VIDSDDELDDDDGDQKQPEAQPRQSGRTTATVADIEPPERVAKLQALSSAIGLPFLQRLLRTTTGTVLNSLVIASQFAPVLSALTGPV